MKKFFLFLVVFITIGVCSSYSKESSDEVLKYDIKCAGSGQQGFYIVEVSAYVDKKKNISMDIVKKCAVHGVIFKGFSGSQGCSSQRAMVSPITEKEHADYFKAFFANDYSSYVSAVDGTVQTMKVGKGYQVTATVQVSKDQLRKTLESAGVLRKLGF